MSWDGRILGMKQKKIGERKFQPKKNGIELEWESFAN